MLRLLLILLFAANLAYAAWGQGWLVAVGWGPSPTNEPWRLEKQMRPEAVQLIAVAANPPPAADAAAARPMPKTEAAAAEEISNTDSNTPTNQTNKAPTAPESEAAPAAPTAPPAPDTQCLQAGPFSQDEAKTLRNALRAQELAWDSYEMRSQDMPGRWMVYLGKFPSQELLNRQRTSLRAQNIDTDRAGGNLEPGLSLGRFSSEEAATRELTRLLRKGVRGARVVQERAAAQVFTLRLPAATAAQQAQLGALGPALAGKVLQRCEEP